MDQLPLRGLHNALNVCAALTAVTASRNPLPALPAAVMSFSPLPHRLEVVYEENGITWIDDSIATTAESAVAALKSFPGRLTILIGGGHDRGQDYAELARVLAESNSILIALPVTGTRLARAARNAGVPAAHVVEVSDLAAAVSYARRTAGPGSVILLSPGAPSYNAYRDFEERGAHFAALARRAN
jgi:UDP-N-acetylmuramoylalanine--D-glutamate ligase